MSKKPLSTMTAQDFIEYKAALGLNGREMATALERHPSTITGYENGNSIPVEVVKKLRELVTQRVTEIQRESGRMMDLASGLGSMIVYQNERQQASGRDIHRTAGRFMRRQRQPDTTTYPAYRMSRERFEVYALALARWTERVRALAKGCTDEAHQRDYVLELRDLQQLAATAPRSAPYDVCIQRNEWDVVSRALRHLASDPEHYARAHALRCHWCKHKGAGFPRRTGVGVQQVAQHPTSI